MDNINKSYDIKGKVALITGAAGGIGTAISKAILEEGAKGINLCDFNEEEGKKLYADLTKCYGPEKVQFIKCNVIQEEEIEAAFEHTIKSFGQIDIVLNNAGIFDETVVKRTVDINLTAVIIGTQLAIEKYLPKYRSSFEGVVVNTASILGLTTVPVAPTYSATKHGIIALGKSYGDPEEYNRTKVRVMSVCPGFTLTPLINAPRTRPQHQTIMDDMLTKAKMQKVEKVSATVLHMIKYGKPGSAWIINNDKMEEANIVEAFNVKSCF